MIADLTLSKLINNTDGMENILGAINYANEFWEEHKCETGENLFHNINLLQSSLEKQVNDISLGKELTFLTGVYRYYDFNNGFIKEGELFIEFKKILKALKGHCMEIDSRVDETIKENYITI